MVRLTLPRYSIVTDQKRVAAAFSRIFQTFKDDLAANRQLTPKYLLEKGRIADHRAYFFIAPWHEEGWIFEQSPTGWTIAKAQKIVGKQTFMRSALHWDQVTVYKADDDEDKVPLRIASLAFGPDKMTFPVYAALLRQSMNLEPGLL